MAGSEIVGRIVNRWEETPDLPTGEGALRPFKVLASEVMTCLQLVESRRKPLVGLHRSLVRFLAQANSKALVVPLDPGAPFQELCWKYFSPLRHGALAID